VRKKRKSYKTKGTEGAGGKRGKEMSLHLNVYRVGTFILLGLGGGKSYLSLGRMERRNFSLGGGRGGERAF